MSVPKLHSTSLSLMEGWRRMREGDTAFRVWRCDYPYVYCSDVAKFVLEVGGVIRAHMCSTHAPSLVRSESASGVPAPKVSG